MKTMTESGERAAAIVKAANKIYDAQCDRGRSYDNALNYEQICEVIAAVEQAAFEAGRGGAEQVRAALSELLALFPSDATIRNLEADDPNHPRPCPINRYPSDKQVLRYRAWLAALPAPPDSGDKKG